MGELRASWNVPYEIVRGGHPNGLSRSADSTTERMGRDEILVVVVDKEVRAPGAHRLNHGHSRYKRCQKWSANRMKTYLGASFNVSRMPSI